MQTSFKRSLSARRRRSGTSRNSVSYCARPAPQSKKRAAQLDVCRDAGRARKLRKNARDLDTHSSVFFTLPRRVSFSAAVSCECLRRSVVLVAERINTHTSRGNSWRSVNKYTWNGHVEAPRDNLKSCTPTWRTMVGSVINVLAQLCVLSFVEQNV